MPLRFGGCVADNEAWGTGWRSEGVMLDGCSGLVGAGAVDVLVGANWPAGG